MQTENFIPTRSQCDQLIDRNELEEEKKFSLTGYDQNLESTDESSDV